MNTSVELCGVTLKNPVMTVQVVGRPDCADRVYRGQYIYADI